MQTISAVPETVITAGYLWASPAFNSMLLFIDSISVDSFFKQHI